MKFLVLLLSVAVVAAHYDSYSIEGGYKEEGKYTYHYEAFVNPAQLPDLERQFAKLHFNGTVELHFQSNNKVVLKLKEYNIFECYSDPKNMSGVYERRSILTERLATEYLKKPVTFVYTNGLVQQVFADPKDPDWSVNTKKGILNLIHVDVTGKDQETGLKDMFTKEEVSIFGICQTTYSHKNYEIVDARQVRRRIGMNFTKTIDYENCTGLRYDIFNKVVKGRNPEQQNNPLKVSATIKHNITGTENRFKIEGVTAKGLYVLYPFAREQGGIPSTTLQRLRLIKEEGSLFYREYPDYHDNLAQRGKLIMSMPSFHKPDIFPPLSPQDRERKSAHIRDTIRRFVSFIPKEAPVQSVTLIPEMSTAFFEIVNNLRDCDTNLLGRVWQKCSQPSDRKWLVYALSIAQTESSVDFMQARIPKIRQESILDFIQGIGFTGKPTRMLITKMKQICNIPRITSNPLLTQACWISASNIAKGFCKVNKICKSWVETEILKALQKVPTYCRQNQEYCQPIKHLSVHTVMSIAENLGRPSFLTALEQIIFSPELLTNIKMHAISSCRPIISISPKRTQLLLLRFFRDFQYDSQLRTLAFSVLMENPHPHLIQITARHLLTEPSVNIRKFVHETFTEMSRSLLAYNDTIRQTCKTVLKMYHELYLPSSMTNYRSLRYTLRGLSSTYNLGAELEGNMIANNRSYIPRFSQMRMRATVLGRKFEVFDSQMYMQGIQDYINWMMSLMRPYGYEYYEDEYNEEKINIQKKIDEVDRQTSHRPRQPETLIFESHMKVFDKLVSVQELHLNKTSSFLDHLMTHLPEIMRIAKMLTEGKTYTWLKPIMPSEVIYTVPSLVGIPLNYNMSSVVVPYVKSAIKVDIVPNPLDPSFWIQKKKLQSVKISGSQNSNSLVEVRGRISFRLPFIEVGALTRKIMNTSTHVTGMTSYNFKTGEYNHECVVPKKVQELFLARTESGHYIKSTQDPIQIIGLGPDQFGKVDIINVTGPCVGPCRSEEWLIRTADGKFLNVQDNKVVLKSKPLKFKVIFHGVNRRIISLYVPGQGYVVLSRKSPNLLVQQTGCGKYFVVDFDNLQQTLIRSLVHLEVSPPGWGLPDRDEVEEVRRIESLAMKEMVQLGEERYIEKGELDPSKAQIRMTYITATPSGVVRLSPKRSQALNITAVRKTNLTSTLRSYSYGNRSCIGKPWGFNLCGHGVLPQELSRSLLNMVYAPMEYRVTCRRDETNQVRKIKTNGRVVTNTTNLLKYVFNTDLVGSSPPRNVKTEISWYRQDYRLRMDVLPSHFDLLKFKKMCYREHFKPDNYSWTVSVHPECKVNQIQADFLAPKQFPRHQMAFRIHFTNQALPQFWRRAMSSLSRNVVVPLLRNASDFWYSNRTYYQNITSLERTDVPYNGTTYIKYFLTRNDTMTFKIQSPSESYVWENVKLNAYIRSFPIGSRYTPVVAKMYWSKGKACCTHSNSTFITFDKVVYNYTLKRQCDHILLRSCYKNMTQFLVLTKKRQGEKQQLKRIVNTFIDQYQIEFIPGPQYSSKPTVRVNGKPISFEQKHEILKNGRPCIYIVWEPKLKNMGLYHVQTGLYVSLRRSYKVRTSISQQFFSKVCGLCGDFNGEPKNEFITPEGRLIRDVQKPKLFDPELEFYQEHIFGNSWFVPGKKCVRQGCKFVRQHVKVERDDAKYCLTSFKVPQCMKKCSASQTEQIKVPITCVARNETAELSRQLKSGQPVTLFTAIERLVPLKVPVKCNCPCGNSYKNFESKEEENQKSKYSDEDYWYNYYQHYFDEY